MVNIQKQTEPAELLQYKADGGTKYDDLGSIKTALRDSLLKEQGFICAYCQEEIENHPLKSKIEHVKPQRDYSALGLNYSNLVICCNGGERDARPRDLHCDSKKSDQYFDGFINPAITELDLLQTTFYKEDGTIYSDIPDLVESFKLLNLNCPKLTNKRKATQEGILEVISQSDQEFIKSLRDESIITTNNKKQPFCGLIWFFTNTFIS